MHSLKRLQQLLNPPAPPSYGQVVEVSSNTLLVATAQGLRQIQRPAGDATGYKPGDTVRLSADTVLGRRAQPTQWLVV